MYTENRMTVYSHGVCRGYVQYTLFNKLKTQVRTQ